MHKLKTLEQLTVDEDGKVLDSRGNTVEVTPIGNPNFIGIMGGVLIKDLIDEEVIKKAPINADGYSFREHGLVMNTEFFQYHGLPVQYWKIKLYHED